MSFASSVCCVHVLKQQGEQNVQYQNECQSMPDKQCQKPKNYCTVVENGRVVVKPLQPANNQTEGTQSA